MSAAANHTILTVAMVVGGGYVLVKALPKLLKKVSSGSSSGMGAGAANTYNSYGYPPGSTQQSGSLAPTMGARSGGGMSSFWDSNSNPGYIRTGNSVVDALLNQSVVQPEQAGIASILMGYTYDGDTRLNAGNDMLDAGAGLGFADESLLNSQAGQIQYDNSDSGINAFLNSIAQSIGSAFNFNDPSLSTPSNGLDPATVAAAIDAGYAGQTQSVGDMSGGGNWGGDSGAGSSSGGDSSGGDTSGGDSGSGDGSGGSDPSYSYQSGGGSDGTGDGAGY